MKKKILYALAALLLLSIIACVAILATVNSFLDTPPSSEADAQKIVIEIAPGSSLTKVAKQLFDANIITNENYFKLYVRYEEKGANLQAGSLEFSTAWTPSKVLHQLMFGKSIAKPFEIPEGLAWWKVAQKLDKAGYVKFEDFDAIIHDRAFLDAHHIPFDSAEGFIYPETYNLVKPYTLDRKSAEAIIAKFIDEFWEETLPLWKQIDEKSPYPSKENLSHYLILASIVDKETGISDEKARVAGVYTNRLQTNMRLQADPTVIYGLGESFKMPLYTKHLRDSSNPYNTYTKAGLPPGPISSPTFSDIEAAINPEKHQYFFFVAKGTGGTHYFSTTYKEHQANVAKYRKTLGR